MSLLRRQLIPSLGGQVGKPPPSYDEIVLADNPSGYWRFNEASGTTLTSLTEAYHATTRDTGGALAAPLWQAEPGPIGLPAADMYPSAVRWGQVGAIPITTTFTFEMWFKRPTLPGGNRLLMGTADGYSGGSYDKDMFLDGSGRLGFYTYAGGSAGTSVVGTTNVCDGAWHHLCVSRDSGGTYRLYVDAVVENSYTHGYHGNNFLMILGANSGFGQMTGQTFLAEVAWYQNQLQPDRVTAHARAGGVAA